jgi:hypothetical protein
VGAQDRRNSPTVCRTLDSDKSTATSCEISAKFYQELRGQPKATSIAVVQNVCEVRIKKNTDPRANQAKRSGGLVTEERQEE